MSRKSLPAGPYSKYSVHHIMTPSPVTITPDTTTEEACEIMKRKRFHHLPVMEKQAGNGAETMVGMIARGDLQRAISVFVGTKIANDRDRQTLQLKVNLLMSKPVFTVTPDTGIRECADMLVAKGFNSAPVVEPDTSRLVGIVTSTDLLTFLCAHLGTGKRP